MLPGPNTRAETRDVPCGLRRGTWRGDSGLSSLETAGSLVELGPKGSFVLPGGGVSTSPMPGCPLDAAAAADPCACEQGLCALRLCSSPALWPGGPSARKVPATPVHR